MFLFLDELFRTCAIPVVSTNDMVPMDIITHMQGQGISVSSPLATGGARYKRKRFARTPQKVTDLSIRRLVGIIKKRNISFPAVPQLMKDLKHLSLENQKNRFYVSALAGWTEFAMKEISFGTSNMKMPKGSSTHPSVSNSIASKLGATKMPQNNKTRDDIRSIRERYSRNVYDTGSTKTKRPQGRRALPRSIRG